jgi:hypothetical protein
MLLSHHNSFVMIINGVLPGGSNTTTPSKAGVKDLSQGHATPEAAVEAINAAFNVF